MSAIKLTDDNTPQPKLLFLHGGGTSTKERFLWLAEGLLEKRVGSVLFDFSGHGESTGKISSSNLSKKTVEAKKAAQEISHPLAVLGSSMGAYIAIAKSTIIVPSSAPDMNLTIMKFGRFELQFTRPLVMGILNVTPDSFSDGGAFLNVDAAIARAEQMAKEGADVIDIGGESSRPGSEPVSAEEELRRVLPIITKLNPKIDVPLSIDTYKPEVAEAALKAGAHIINDINGLRDPDMVQIAARYEAPVVLMHMQGVPKTMQEHPTYTDVIEDIKLFFKQQIKIAEQAGVKHIILDPGIGFGKTLEHNLEILNRLAEFQELGKPLLIGPSRKSFIGTITGEPVDSRLEGTVAAAVIGAWNGANIVRVHDVKECKRALQITAAIKEMRVTINQSDPSTNLG